jgi:hypothetical protein
VQTGSDFALASINILNADIGADSAAEQLRLNPISPQ